MSDAPQIPAPVQPSVQPVAVAVGEVDMPTGGRMIVMQIFTPCGTTVVFLDAAAAAQVAGQLGQASRNLKTGLILPLNMDKLGPNGHGPS